MLIAIPPDSGASACVKLTIIGRVAAPYHLSLEIQIIISGDHDVSRGAVAKAKCLCR
jgi:hypothetical protein